MTNRPCPPLLLGLAGLLPSSGGTHGTVAHAVPLGRRPSARASRTYVQLFYGAVILSFMSGVLWGFSTKTTGARAALGYGLSVLPALWAFFFTGGGPTLRGDISCRRLCRLLLLDRQFARWGLAPDW